MFAIATSNTRSLIKLFIRLTANRQICRHTGASATSASSKRQWPFWETEHSEYPSYVPESIKIAAIEKAIVSVTACRQSNQPFFYLSSHMCHEPNMAGGLVSHLPNCPNRLVLRVCSSNHRPLWHTFCRCFITALLHQPAGSTIYNHGQVSTIFHHRNDQVHCKAQMDRLLRWATHDNKIIIVVVAFGKGVFVV